VWIARNLRHGCRNGSTGLRDRDYSALRASPFALLRAAPSGVQQRVASQSGRRTRVAPNSPCQANTWTCERPDRRRKLAEPLMRNDCLGESDG
jgi:hypothetical protein